MTLRQRIICIILIIATCAALVGTLIASGFSVQYEVSVGSVCPEDIYASRQVIDTVTTAARRKAASDAVEEQFNIDFNAYDIASDKIRDTITALRSSRDAYQNRSEDSFFSPSTLINETNLSYSQFQDALSLPSSDFELLAKYTPEFLEDVMTEGVTDKDEGVEAFSAKFDTLQTVSLDTLALAVAICRDAISVNKTPDEEKTLRLREDAAKNVAEIVYMKNQTIARRGEIITEAQYAMLVELGFVKGESTIDIRHTVSGIALLLLITGLVVMYYIMIAKNDISTSPVSVTVICALLVISGAFIIFFATRLGANFMYLMPLSMIPALISLLLSANLATMVNVITAALAGVQLNNPSVAIAMIIGGTCTAYLFSKVRRRAHLLPATLVSALLYAVIYSVVLLDTTKTLVGTVIVFFYAFFGGFFGGILTIGTIPFWEAIFDVITPMKLGELSNPEHKLLKKLLLKAPGTYHHSLTVANMADAAAEVIDANSLLARVGAYYHDIGKMENPLYFKENQFGGNNPHDELPPEESARIIISHVSDGVALSQQYRLPRIVRDIIAEHHGTTTASFFLYKARQADPDVDTSIFTYDGPTPQSKEATIIMLADACEAAVRAMREKGNEDVSKIVDDIVSSRISDRQLSLSNLTFADLDKVKASFVKTLEQYFHKRILYPQNKKQ